MGFVDDISDYRSLAIVGLEKNTGKTECLNYILRRIKDSADRFALTSIGIDGENRDQVCQTPKPEIIVPEGMIFVTSEKHYRERRLVAEIMEIDDHRTALGRLVIARAKTSGKVLLSGPADTAGLKSLIRHMKDFGVRTTLVDGALSRLSLASPTVTEAMVLATGAAVSGNIRELVRRTRYVCDLIDLEEVDEVLKTNDGSTIFENGNKFTIAVLTEIDEEGIAPLNKVAGNIKRILIQKKKADLLKKELASAKSGSESLLSIARKAGLEVKEANEISFNSFQIPGAGIEPKVIAASSITEQGKISEPIAGNQGVYLILVNNRTTEEVTPDMVAQSKQALQQSNMYRANYQAIQAILKNGEIVDQRYKFY